MSQFFQDFFIKAKISLSARFITPNLVNIRSFIRIRCKGMAIKIWELRDMVKKVHSRHRRSNLSQALGQKEPRGRATSGISDERDPGGKTLLPECNKNRYSMEINILPLLKILHFYGPLNNK